MVTKHIYYILKTPLLSKIGPKGFQKDDKIIKNATLKSQKTTKVFNDRLKFKMLLLVGVSEKE